MKKQPTALKWLIRSFVIVAALCAMGGLILSYSISYSSTRDLLSSLYGAGRTARYFSPAVFRSAINRIRGMAFVLGLLAAILFVGRDWLVRQLQPSFNALTLSFSHLTRRTSPRWDALTVTVLFLMTALAAVIRLPFIGQPMRYDEATTVLGYASKPIYLALSLYNEPNNHLFHTLLVHISMLLFGASEWTVRLPAFVAGCLLPVFTFAFVTRVASRSAAYLAAALVATSSVLVEFSTNARGYTIICVLTLGLLICGLEAIRKASPAWFALFSLCTILGCWTVPLFVFPFVGSVIWLLFETSNRSQRFKNRFRYRLAISCVMSGLITALLYLPVVVVNGPAALFENRFVSPLRGQLVVGSHAFGRNFELFLKGNASEIHRLWLIWNRDLPGWWPIASLIAFVVCLAANVRFRRIALSIAFWVIALFIARRLMLSPRNWLMFLPLFVSGVAIGVAVLFNKIVQPERLQSRIAAFASILLAIGLGTVVVHNRSVLASNDTGVLGSARDIASFLESRGVSADDVMCSYVSDIPLQYYWWRQTGKRQPNTLTSAGAMRDRELHDAWVIVNKSYDESFDESMRRFGIQRYSLLEQREFSNSAVYHVSWNAPTLSIAPKAPVKGSPDIAMQTPGSSRLMSRSPSE